MDDRPEDRETLEIAPLKPRPQGRGLPVPPVIPLVAILCAAFGLSIGYGLAARPAPSPVPIVTVAPTIEVRLPIATATAAVPPELAAPSEPTAVEFPPPSGYTLPQALKEVQAMDGFPTDILSARVGHYPSVSNGWVWLIVVPFSFQDCGGFQAVGPSPATDARATDAPCRLKNTTEMIVIDYQTGEFLEDRIPAG